MVGFPGNEAVALYRVRVGRRIGSAALRADGMHARADGLTSLARGRRRRGRRSGLTLSDAHEVAHDAEHELAPAIPKLSSVVVHAYPAHDPVLSS